MKKLFLICLALILSVHSAALAKGLSGAERVKVALEMEDTSRHRELSTAQILSQSLNRELGKKNLLNIVETKVIGTVTSEEQLTATNFGELLVFGAIELPATIELPANFDKDFYESCGANYVLRCEVLALGVTKVEDNTLGIIFGSAGGITSLIGSGSSSRAKTLRRVGGSVGLGGFIQTERTALNTVVNVQYVDLAADRILWQEYFIGRAVKHHKASKKYADTWTQAYSESVDDVARRITKRVNKYVRKGK